MPVSSPSHHQLAIAWTIATLRAGTSREAASRAAGKHLAWVARVERCETNPSAADLFRLIRALGASATEFGQLYDRRLAELGAAESGPAAAADGDGSS